MRLSAWQKECGTNSVERIGNKISYIKKPQARSSFPAAVLSVISLGFMAASVGIACHTRGDAPLAAAAFGFCSIITALVSLVYGVLSFFEKEKNYRLARVSTALAGTLTIVWLIIIVAAR